MENLMNAAISVEACRSVLSREGQHEAAEALFGLEVLDVASANMTIALLSNVKVEGEQAKIAKSEALRALHVVGCPGVVAA